MAVASGDDDGKTQALADLDGYADDFAAFLNSANPNVDPAAFADNLRMHVGTLTAVIDAQAEATPQESGNQQTAYMALRDAYAHMGGSAAALSAAISTQFPDLFPGAADSDGSGLRAALISLLGEHTHLVARSATASVGARTIEFEAAAGALDANSQDIAGAIGSIYGDAAGEAFLPLWRKHIGFFIDYSLAVAADDTNAQDAARTKLEEYATDFAAFLNSANENLPIEAVAGLVGTHAGTTLAVIDAASMEDAAVYYTALREAYAHMGMIANPLADAIIAQFPDNFANEGMGMDEMTDDAEMEETESSEAEEAAPVAEEATTGETVMVDIKTFMFMPSPLEIAVGTTVIWTNQDGAGHTVTAGAPNALTGLFDSGVLSQGQTFSFTFTEAGDYDYFCQRHPSMMGQVVVQ